MPTTQPASAAELLQQLRTQIAAAHKTAAQLRDAAPVDARFEASNVVAGLADVDELVRDATAALAGCTQ